MDEPKQTDLLPSDIVVDLVEDDKYRASLCFLALNGGRKCYVATSTTEAAAKQDLAAIMKEHLDRAAA